MKSAVEARDATLEARLAQRTRMAEAQEAKMAENQRRAEKDR